MQHTIGQLIAVKDMLPRPFPELGVRMVKMESTHGLVFGFLNYWNQVSARVHANCFMPPHPPLKLPVKVQWHQIIGASSFLGQIPSPSAIKYTPLRRRPCSQALGRLQVLADGTVVRCQFDAAGRHVLGRVGERPLLELWRSEPERELRRRHLARAFAQLPAPCTDCSDWYHLWD